MSESTKTDTKELCLPQVGILQCVTNNLFCDAALQSSALVILGEAISHSPELTDPDVWGWHEFTPETNNVWQQFKLESKAVGHVRPEQLLENLTPIIHMVRDEILSIVTKAEPRSLVAGTIRLNIVMTPDGGDDGKALLNLWLLWISHNEG